MVDSTDIHRALIFQGRGSLGAYEAGAYKAINEELSAALRKIGRDKEPLFHIVSGTSIGAINASILVSYVKENGTWEGSAERLIDFWDYLSTQSWVDKILILLIIGIFGIVLINELHQESLPEDILALRNL